MNEQNSQLEALQDIRDLMKRSSRFLSLSGLSGIAAGAWALVGAWFANKWIEEFFGNSRGGLLEGESFEELKVKLIMLAVVVLACSLLSAFYFTWRRAGRNIEGLWNHSSKLLAINMLIPLVAGGCFILAMLRNNEWRYVAPASLIFYGLALVNGSKYTLSEIRYLGLTQILLGLINTQFIGFGLYFWALGFGVLHIIYGFAMWWKYERTSGINKDGA